MGRSHAVFPLFVLIAAAWGYGSAALIDGNGAEPLLAVCAGIVPVAAFAWIRRRCDALEFVLPVIAVAYAAYIGIALARVPSITLLTAWTRGPLGDKWPAVLIAGVPFALILTVVVAMPLYMLPRRRRIDPHADEALWTYVREHDYPSR